MKSDEDARIEERNGFKNIFQAIPDVCAKPERKIEDGIKIPAAFLPPKKV